MRWYVLWLLMHLLSLAVIAQKETKTITKELSFPAGSTKNLLVVDNINGSIHLEGYNGNSIMVEVKQTITAKMAENIQKGWQEITLGVIQKEEIIYLYMDYPCSNVNPASITKEDLRNDKSFNWNNHCRWNPSYDYTLDFTIKVPNNTDIDISTINQGDIQVANVNGKIKVNNVNGGIKVDGIANSIHAHTINGDLILNYLKNPTTDSKYYTLNGDIKAGFIKGLAAKVYFKSFNGDFFTKIDEIKKLPVEIEKSAGKGNGISYKIGGRSAIQIRSGGPELNFETFNGDVYLSEN